MQTRKTITIRYDSDELIRLDERIDILMKSVLDYSKGKKVSIDILTEHIKEEVIEKCDGYCNCPSCNY